MNTEEWIKEREEKKKYLESQNIDWYDKLVKDPSLNQEPKEYYRLPEY